MNVMNLHNKMVVNYMLETMSMLQITHGNKDEEWFVGRYWNADPEKCYHALCTGRRSR